MPTSLLPALEMPVDKLRLSDLAPTFVQSEIRSMTAACSAANGINLAQGVCDTDPPHPVVETAMAAIRSGQNIYTRHDGITALREGIAAKFASFNRLTVDPATQVLVTSGATGAMHATLMALLNPGDACLVFEPFYGYHVSTLISLRVKPVVVPLQAPDWTLDGDALERMWNPGIRAILLNSPCNPCGAVFSRGQLEVLAAYAQRHNLFVITDEMYEYFVYDGRSHLSLATLPGMAERTITISGFSKTFSVTGWRLGYLAASQRWLATIGYFHDLLYVCAPAPLQHGAAAGLMQLPPSFYTGLATEYQSKRDLLCGALAAAGMNPSVPSGAYYVLADASRVPGETAALKARRLLADTGVAAVAGSAFFGRNSDGTQRGEHLLRFCFAKKDAELEEACERLRTYRG